MKNALWWVVLLVVAVLAVRELFPKRVEVPVLTQPITIYDTVERTKLDTQWVVRTRQHTDTLWRERVTLTKPDTVYLRPPHLWGLTTLSVSAKVGGETLARGFALEPDTGSSPLTLRREWQIAFRTPGPLRELSVVGDTVRTHFDPPPPRGCGWWCRASHYAIGAAGGFAACKL